MSGDEDLANAVKRDYRGADLDDRTRALMDFAVELTRQPASVGGSVIDGLRAHGWDDAEILTATQIVGFFNQYVRIAEALGVEPEPEMTRDPAVWPSP